MRKKNHKGFKQCESCKHWNGTRAKKCSGCGSLFTKMYGLQQIRTVARLTKAVGGTAQMREILTLINTIGLRQFQEMLEVLELAN